MLLNDIGWPQVIMTAVFEMRMLAYITIKPYEVVLGRRMAMSPIAQTSLKVNYGIHDDRGKLYDLPTRWRGRYV